MALTRTHRPVWRQERCLPCGACTRRCPASVFDEQAREAGSLRARVLSSVRFPPGPRPAVPPCRAACPLGQDVPGYVAACARGDFQRALAIICETNPLPATCGRLCAQPCARACVRASLDAPVDIRALKRLAAERSPQPPALPVARERGETVAVIGAGPAGLAAAAWLRRDGFQVRVLEAEPEPGGLVRWAVPDFDFPRAELERDVARLRAAGVEIACGRRLESTDEIRSLLAGGARAVLLATGAGRGLMPPVDGADLAGCLDGLSFARRFSAPGARLEGAAVVAGSGPMAVACARMAARAGGSPVHLLVDVEAGDCPADPERLRRAEREGIQILHARRVASLEGEKRVEAVIHEPVIFGPADPSGRRRALEQTGKRSAARLPASSFVSALDRDVDLGWLGGEIRLGALGNAQTDERGATSLAGVFAAGEAAVGARNAIGAIATGVRAAAAIRAWLDSGGRA